MLRANPRAVTPGCYRRYEYEAGKPVRRVILPDVPFSEVSRRTAVPRWQVDHGRSVNDQLREFRVKSRRGARVLRKKEEEESKKEDPLVGPACHVLDYREVLAIQELNDQERTVKERLNDHRVTENLEVVEDDVATRFDSGPGEFEAIVKDQFLKETIQRITNEAERQPPSRRRRRRRQVSDEPVDDSEALAREALFKLEKLTAMHKVRKRIHDGVSLPKIVDLTEKPRQWMERALVDAVLRGAPLRTRRHLVALALFPGSAPTTLKAAIRGTVGRVLKSGAKSDWIPDRIAELKTTTGEPLVVAAVKRWLQETEDESRKRCVMILHSFGASMSVQDVENEWSGLHFAAEEGDSEIVETLVSLGVPVDQRTRNGETALHIATDVRTACKLVELGADVSKLDHQHRSPLHRAAQRGILPIIELLLVAGAESLEDVCGDTPVDLAKRYGHPFCAMKIAVFRDPLATDFQTLTAGKRLELLEGKKIDLLRSIKINQSSVSTFLSSSFGGVKKALMSPPSSSKKRKLSKHLKYHTRRSFSSVLITTTSDD